MIEIPIEIGDIVRVGRFKNKRIKVKSIDYDEYGLPLINGRPLLTMRIEKLIPVTEQTNNTMKKSILHTLIREEIRKALAEADPKKTKAKGSIVRHLTGYRVGDDLYDAVAALEDFINKNAPEINLDDLAEIIIDIKDAAYMDGFDDAKEQAGEF